MSSLFRTQRRAEHFDSLLEGGRPDGLDRQTTELLELVGALRSVPEPQARPAFVADLRERLMVAAESELVTAPARPRDDVSRLTIKPRRTHRERRVGIALGTVAILGATTSMAVASQGAIPGDTLYPLKRAIENTEAGFSVGDDAKGETILGNASGRLDEVDQLTRGSNPDATLVAETLDTFADQASQAGDLLIADYEATGHEDSIRQLHEFAENSLAVLGDLEASVPSSAHNALLAAAQAVFGIDAAAEQVCPLCGDAVTEVPAQLLAGATTAVDDTTDSLAGGELAGTTVPSEGAGPGKHHETNGGKDSGRPSGLNPPESPVVLPSELPTSPGDTAGDTTDDATGGIDDLLPSVGVGVGTGKGNGGKGKGGKHKPVDLAPVTDTVNDVVDGVVEGVNGLLGGLTGNAGGQ